MGKLDSLLVHLYLALQAPTRAVRRRDERGDVPGWVLITVMSVGLMIAIGAVATPQLRSLLREALNRVQ